MSRAAYERYKYVHQKMKSDGEYLHLEREQQRWEPGFQAVMDSLTERQSSVIAEYFGICAEMDQRCLEIACFAEKREKKRERWTAPLWFISWDRAVSRLFDPIDSLH